MAAVGLQVAGGPSEVIEVASDDHDLALNAPGAAVLAKANEVRASSPQPASAWGRLWQRLFGPEPADRAWRVGAEGERRVGVELQRLQPAWQALHSVPVGTRGSDIDHVVVGPGGVFTINTKHHPSGKVWASGDTVMVDGFRVPYVRNARFEAKRASRLLTTAAGFEVPVTGLIVFVGVPRGFDVKHQPKDQSVHLLARVDLARWLNARGPVLLIPEVEAVFDVARRSSTWQ